MLTGRILAGLVVASAIGCGPGSPSEEDGEVTWHLGDFFFEEGNCGGVGCTVYTLHSFQVREDGSVTSTKEDCGPNAIRSAESRWELTDDPDAVRLVPDDPAQPYGIWGSAVDYATVTRMESCGEVRVFLTFEGKDFGEAQALRGKACRRQAPSCTGVIEWCDGPPEPCED